MPIQVLVARDYEQMSELGAKFVRAEIRKRLHEKPEYLLGLATGNSPVGLYKNLAASANRGDFDPHRIRSFNLDEYVGLPGENAQLRTVHPASYCYFMVTEFFALLQHKFVETNVPFANLIDQAQLIANLNKYPRDWRETGGDSGRAITINAKAESPYLAWVKNEILDAYAKKIARYGGIDLQIIGVGGRGHVAFHEAGIPFRSGEVLLVKLDENTVINAVADGHFDSIDSVPRFAVTMGAELVYRARTVLLLASGERKQEPVARSLLEDPSTAIPISYGQKYAQDGGELIYIIDEVAGKLLLKNRAKLKAKGVKIVDRRRA